jgi:PAS domain S-box-containing protein
MSFRDRTEGLTMSERRFRRLFADAPAGMLLINRNRTIVDANEALCSIAGAHASDLVGRDFLDFVPRLLRPQFDLAFAKVFRTGRLEAGERPLRRGDGSVYWAQLSASVLEVEGLVVVHVQDVTEARRMREQLAERNAQLEQADRLKDELISVVSHDLRTPLTSIMGYLELAYEEQDEESRREYLGVAQRNATRLHRLVDDLLFVSRVESGRAGLELEEHDVCRLVRDAVENALPTASTRRVSLDSVCDPGGEAIVDAHRVSEAVENLISNALKFTPPNGRVDVRVVVEGATLAIRVSDTGIGVREEDLGHLFDRFFRTENAEAVPGAGLGLSIVKAIADAHGGTIEVESTVGTGTTFELRLPRAPAALDVTLLGDAPAEST